MIPYSLKKGAVILMMALSMCIPLSGYAMVISDLDRSGDLSMKDLIIALKVNADDEIGEEVYPGNAFDSERQAIGIRDAIYILQVVSELRNPETTNLRMSIRTTIPKDSDISAFWLDIQGFEIVTKTGDSYRIGEPGAIDLLDDGGVGVGIVDAKIPESEIEEVHLVFGDGNVICTDKGNYTLSMPEDAGGEYVIDWDGAAKNGRLNHLLLNLDLEDAVVSGEDGEYYFHPAIDIVSDIQMSGAANSAVIEPGKPHHFKVSRELSLEVEPGSVSKPSIVWAEKTGMNDLGPVFKLGPDGTTFRKPIHVSLSYDPDNLPDGLEEADLILLHDGNPISTKVNTHQKRLKGKISHFSTISTGYRSAQATLLYQYMVPDENQDIVLSPGERFDIAFYLKNVSSYNAVDYRLYESDTGFDDTSTNYPKFTIYPGETRAAEVLNFPAPSQPGEYTIWFRIYDTYGTPLPVLSKGTVYIEIIVEDVPVPPPSLGKPMLMSPSNGASGVDIQPKLNWKDVPNAEVYRVFVDSSQTRLAAIGDDDQCSDCVDSSNTGDASAYTVPGGKLAEGETYYWRVKAWAGHIGSAFSDIWRFTVDSGEPPPPPPTCDQPIPQAVLKYMSDEIIPSDAQPGDRVTVVFTLKNDSGVDAIDYTLAEYGSNEGDSLTSWPTFTILAGDTGTAMVDNFPLPSEKVYVDIVDTCGEILVPLSGGRMYFEAGGSQPPPPPQDPCEEDSVPPTISNMDVYQDGSADDGKIIVVASVTDDTGVASVTLEFNGEDKPMQNIGGSLYGIMLSYDPDKYHSYLINAVDDCGNSSRYPETGPVKIRASSSENYGFKCKIENSCDPGQCGTKGDPVNTTNGNFMYRTLDALVKGPGGTSISMIRYYNSLAPLWTGGSIVRIEKDGGMNPISEPPQYFGPGWSFPYNEYLLVVDKLPFYEGLQVQYADGRTSTFKKEEDRYIADSPGNFDVIVKEGDEYVLYNDSCQCTLETRRFSADGKLESISDRNGNTIKLTYEGDLLKRIENAAGRSVSFSHDGDGRIVSAALPESVALRYEYSGGLLTGFVDGNGHRTEYIYADNGQLTDIITPKGHPAVRVAYDADDARVLTETVGETVHHIFTYEDDSNTVLITDAYGAESIHRYDDKKRLVKEDYPDGTSEGYEYDEDYNRTAYTDQAGVEWHWTYDDRGNRLTADGPSGWHREWTYNELNLITAMRENVDDSTIRITTFEYDDNGNAVKFCNPLGDCGSVVYDARGLPVEMTDFNGNIVENTFDAEGDLTAVTDPENAVTSFDHDGLGRVTQMTKPMGGNYFYTYDNENQLVSVDGPMDYHIEFAYDANDNLAQRIDPNGGEIRYEYNASDALVKVTNPLGFNIANYNYGLMGEVTGFMDAEGRSWFYEYDEMLRVIHAEGPLSAHFYYAYNPVGKIVEITDANGRVDYTEYDAFYRPVESVRNYRPGEASDADTNVTATFEYNLVGNLLKVVDPEGNPTEFTYDLLGRKTLKRDAEGYEWEYAYDAMRNLVQTTNPRGYSSMFEYTPTYRLARAIDPENHAASYGYDQDGRLTDITDPRGIVTHFEYDGLGRLTRKTRNYKPGFTADAETNVITEYAYDMAGNLRYVTNPRNYQAEIIYDAAHRTTEVVGYEGGRTSFVYDRVNNLLGLTDANGHSTTYVYNELNRLVELTNAENETTAYRYDPMGNRTHLIEADGTDTKYAYDWIYRLNGVTRNYQDGAASANDTNVNTAYTYDARGLLTRITNALGAQTAFDYNDVGRMVREVDPLGNTWEYTYDGVGNRVARIDAKGDLTEYEYFPDNRLQQIRYAADETSVAYVYDPNNNRTQMADWLGNTTWRYDPLNRITEQIDPFDRVVSSEYDAAGNRIGMVYPDGNRIAYTYSPNNWMASMIDPEGGVIGYKRDLTGNVLSISNPNDTETLKTYDKVYRTITLINRQTSGGKKINSAFEYTYNEIGHVTGTVKEYGWRNPPVETETYSYDGLHRLTGVSIDPIKNNGEPVEMAYVYDAVGNRLSWKTNEDLTTNEPWDAFEKTYTYNAANRMLRVVTDSAKNNPNDNFTTDFTYDPNGNRINKLVSDANGPLHGVDYTFDPENRMIEALDYQLTGYDHFNRIDRAVTDLEYDGGGRRLVKTYDPKYNAAKGVEKRVEYVFDGLDPVAENFMLNGQWENFYRGANGWITMMHHFKSGAAGQRYWYHYNRKGDVVGLTKHNGNSHHNYRYDPYGGVVPDNGNFTDPHNHYMLTDKEYDENTGLIYFGARHYDPSTGVWLTQDLYRGKLESPVSIQRYMYVSNNPINYIDLLGFLYIKVDRSEAKMYVYTDKNSAEPIYEWEVKVGQNTKKGTYLLYEWVESPTDVPGGAIGGPSGSIIDGTQEAWDPIENPDNPFGPYSGILKDEQGTKQQFNIHGRPGDLTTSPWDCVSSSYKCKFTGQGCIALSNENIKLLAQLSYGPTRYDDTTGRIIHTVDIVGDIPSEDEYNAQYGMSETNETGGCFMHTIYITWSV